MKEIDEPLYTILLNNEEVSYLCEALERGFRLANEENEIALWLSDNKGGQMQVVLNEPGYDLVSHLQFGGVNRGKAWARVEA